jgi:hypothetical protein
VVLPAPSSPDRQTGTHTHAHTHTHTIFSIPGVVRLKTAKQNTKKKQKQREKSREVERKGKQKKKKIMRTAHKGAKRAQYSGAAHLQWKSGGAPFSHPHLLSPRSLMNPIPWREKGGALHHRRFRSPARSVAIPATPDHITLQFSLVSAPPRIAFPFSSMRAYGSTCFLFFLPVACETTPPYERKP